MIRHCAAWRAVLSAMLISSACGGATTATPPAAPSPVGASTAATNYLNEVTGIMQVNSINRGQIDWVDFKARVSAKAQGAQTITDTYPAISLALGLLNDHHSFFVTPSNGSVGNPSGASCGGPSVSAPAMPADIGYVRVGAFSGTDTAAARAFADSIQKQIRDADSDALGGWVVDVRGNLGGNMWPMVAGVGPVLGDGIAGYFVYPSPASAVAWSYAAGSSSSGGQVAAQTTTVYELKRRAPKVGVLTDGLVASSGEAVVVSFRARPNTRSFGTATCGLSTSNQTFRLSDGAMLYLTTAVMADRNRTAYGQSIVPDEIVTGDAEVVQRAIAWIRSS